MKQSLKHILSGQLILIPAIFLAACSSPFNSNKSSEYQIPWRSEGGKYELQNVSIRSLSDPESLSSPLVRLFVTPAEDNGSLAGPLAVGRFMTSTKGVRIPLDFVSLQGASIHAHFERVYEFDRAVGVDRYLTWPIQISIETEILSKQERTNNAFFDGNRNAILILPYKDETGEGLPLSLNGGVLTHEHFHSIFDKLVMKRLSIAGLKVDRHISELAALEPVKVLSESKPGGIEPKIDSIEFNEFLLRATNEGLADFWAWLQLDDTDFVGRSIGGLRECRRLDKQFLTLPSASELKPQVFIDSITKHEGKLHVSWMYYQVGAQYARFFRELTMAVYDGKPSYVERVEAAQALVAALNEFSQVVIQKFTSEDIATDKIAELFVSNLAPSRLSKKSCELLSEFKRDGDDLPQACSSFGVSAEQVTKNKIKRSNNSPRRLQECSCKMNKSTGLCE